MSFDFTQSEYDYLHKNCRFNKHNLEEKIFEMRCDGCSIIEISMETNLSIPTVNRRIASIKKKIMKVIGT